MVVVATHPLPSVMVIVYVPAGAPFTVYEPPSELISSPLGSPVFGPTQLISYGAVPPLAIPVIVPVDPPLHNTAVFVAEAVTEVGSVIVEVVVVVQPLASVTVIVYVPAETPVIV